MMVTMRNASISITRLSSGEYMNRRLSLSMNTDFWTFPGLLSNVQEQEKLLCNDGMSR